MPAPGRHTITRFAALCNTRYRHPQEIGTQAATKKKRILRLRTYGTPLRMTSKGTGFPNSTVILSEPKASRRIRIPKITSIFPAQLALRLFFGDLTGITLGHDLHIPVIQVIAQIEEGGNDHTDDGHQRVHDPQTA